MALKESTYIFAAVSITVIGRVTSLLNVGIELAVSQCVDRKEKRNLDWSCVG